MTISCGKGRQRNGLTSKVQRPHGCGTSAGRQQRGRGCFKFAGRIPFKGVPVATSVPGVLGATDTITQRLDDAVFNRRGVATTRLMGTA